MQVMYCLAMQKASTMTPTEWYSEKKKAYMERYGTAWKHLSMYSDSQNSELCETAMRSGIECRFLKPNGADEIEMVANAIMIRDYIKERHNSAR